MPLRNGWGLHLEIGSFLLAVAAVRIVPIWQKLKGGRQPIRLGEASGWSSGPGPQSLSLYDHHLPQPGNEHPEGGHLIPVKEVTDERELDYSANRACTMTISNLTSERVRARLKVGVAGCQDCSIPGGTKMKIKTRVLWHTAVLAALLLAASPAMAAGDLYLLANVGDTDDREIVDAGRTLDKALDGKRPDRIDEGAERYFVLMPESTTINAFDGNATVVGEKTVEADPLAAAEVRGSGIASSDGEDVGDTGWIGLKASVASVFYFSTMGDGESSWRREPARLFIRRFADGRVVVMMGGKDVSPPID